VTARPDPLPALAEVLLSILVAWARSKLDLVEARYSPTIVADLFRSMSMPPLRIDVSTKGGPPEFIEPFCVECGVPVFHIGDHVHPGPRLRNVEAAWEEAIDEDARRELDAYLEWKPWN
jgi:hypothetical protein